MGCTPSAPEEQTEAEPSEKSRATAYFGPSSGVTLTENLSSIVEDAAWTNRSIPIHDTGHQEPPSPAPTAEQGKAVPPDDTVGRQLLDAYFVNMHTRLPFINCAEMLQLHSRRYDVPGAGQKEQYGMFKLFMIYAIGAAMPQLTEQYESTTPSAYYATAMQFDSALRESLSITGIEGRMLMIIYELRSSSSSNLWYTIGTAMRICIDLGMHRESHYRTMKPLEAQLHRRLFWSVYVIERHVSWSLGRPFSIAEDEIDAQIPADTDDLTSRTNVANDLRACSSAMFAMAERKSSFRKYRDDLENMINRVMAFVDEASTPSLCIPEQSTAGVEGSSGLHFSNLENSKDPVASTLDLQSAAFIEAQEQEASLNARNSFASVSLEDFWADESLNLPTLDVFGFGWDNLYSEQ
ncbi:hypothetical protein APSETT445_000618 [Aspergillus pseudonomiae]